MRLKSRGPAPSRRPWLRKLRLPGLLVLLLLVSSLFGKPLDPKVDAGLHQAVNAAAEYFSDAGAVVDALLEQTNFQPNAVGIPQASWDDFNPLYRLETAYLSAEQAHRGSGRYLLYLLARDLAQRYPSAAENRDLQAILQEVKPPEGGLQFAAIPREQNANREGAIPEPMRRAIEVLALYCEGGRGTSVFSLLTNQLDLSPLRARQLMRSYPTNREILLEAFEELAEGQRNVAMARVVEYCDITLPNTFGQDRTFNRWRNPPERPAVPPFGPAPESPGGGFRGPNDPRPYRTSDGPRRPGPDDPRWWRPEAGRKDPNRPKTPVVPSVERYRKYYQRNFDTFMRREYGGPRPRTFRPVIMSPRGFGGVVLGEEVTAPGLGKVLRLTWKESKGETEWGDLEFDFGNGDLARMPRVRRSDALAAYRIVYTGLPAEGGLPPIFATDLGQAVGLVGLEKSTDYFECGPTSFLREGRRFNFVLHPALVDLSLGWSVLMCDVLPLDEMRPQLLARLEKAAGRPARDSLEKIFDRKERWFTYKFSDVPLRIIRAQGAIQVERPADPARPLDAALRRSAFLSLRQYRDNLAPTKPEDAVEVVSKDERFYPLVPDLIRASSDFDRLNQFARLMAAVRWAKATGASFEQPPGGGEQPAVGGSVVVTRQGVIKAPAFDVADADREQADRLRLCLASLTLPKQFGLASLDSKYLREAENVWWKEFQALAAQPGFSADLQVRATMQMVAKLVNLVEEPGWAVQLSLQAPPRQKLLPEDEQKILGDWSALASKGKGAYERLGAAQKLLLESIVKNAQSADAIKSFLQLLEQVASARAPLARLSGPGREDAEKRLKNAVDALTQFVKKNVPNSEPALDRYLQSAEESHDLAARANAMLNNQSQIVRQLKTKFDYWRALQKRLVAYEAAFLLVGGSSSPEELPEPAVKVAGQLEADVPQFKGKPSQTHEVQVEGGQLYRFDLLSKDFDAYLSCRMSKAISWPGTTMAVRAITPASFSWLPQRGKSRRS